jgi:hypothetical protein
MSRHRIIKGSHESMVVHKRAMVSKQFRENLQMALKYEVTSLDDIDATLHGLYQATADGSKYVLEVEGVKPLTDFNKVYSSLEKERNDHKQVKQRLSAFGELEPETIQQQLARIAELEEIAKNTTFDESKLDAMANARALARTQPIEAEKKQIAERAKELEARIAKYEQIDRQRRMADEFSAKIKAAKVDPRFEETIMLKAERLFNETDEGKFLTKDEYLPFDMWLMQQQTVAPYWWGDSVGGGATGSKTSFRGSNPFVTGNLTEQAAMFNENPALAEQLMAAAAKK